jgi:FixJ family two-component response regulator
MPAAGRRIYIVDDDESVRRALARLLRTDGYCPVLVGSGDALLEMNDIEPDALVICDLRMPGTGGFEVYEELMGRNINLPFIFVTAVDDEATVSRAKSIGHAMFSKPIDGHKLLVKLSSLCGAQ